MSHLFANLVKLAGDTELSYAMQGRLVASSSGWILLEVPNSLIRGVFDTMKEPGIELPWRNGEVGNLNAHISVIRKEEVAKLGGPDKITERGHMFHYTLGPLRSCVPHGWAEMSKCWMLEVRSPELEQLRKSYGLSALPNDNKFAFHITVAVRRKSVLRPGEVTKTSEALQDEVDYSQLYKIGVQPYFTDADLADRSINAWQLTGDASQPIRNAFNSKGVQAVVPPVSQRAPAPLPVPRQPLLPEASPFELGRFWKQPELLQRQLLRKKMASSADDYLRSLGVCPECGADIKCTSRDGSALCWNDHRFKWAEIVDRKDYPAKSAAFYTREELKSLKTVNTSPTPAQQEAGNYQKAHINFHGLDIAIENPKGSTRSGTSANGKKWSIVMKNSYGYVKGTEGKDGDHVDVFIGENPESELAFVVDQLCPDTGKFDEHKVMLGFRTLDEAKAAYLSNYEKDWQGLGSITALTLDQFKTWLDSGDTTRQLLGQTLKLALLIGKHQGVPASDFNQQQLSKGRKVEEEHTDSPAVATEIAKDHLSENKNYYKVLDRVGL